MTTPRFVVVEISEARALAAAAADVPALAPVAERIMADTGGQLWDIALMLKQQALCPCCVQADMAHECSTNEARRHGRRLQAQLDKAVGKVAPVPAGSRDKPAAEL